MPLCIINSNKFNHFPIHPCCNRQFLEKKLSSLISHQNVSNITTTSPHLPLPRFPTVRRAHAAQDIIKRSSLGLRPRSRRLATAAGNPSVPARIVHRTVPSASVSTVASTSTHWTWAPFLVARWDWKAFKTKGNAVPLVLSASASCINSTQPIAAVATSAMST